MVDVYELSARELYDMFVQQLQPATVMEMGRDDIASQLMVDDGLDQEPAYYAADQILAHAQGMLTEP
jgi:hypothetical protein